MAEHAYIIQLTLQRQLSHLNGRQLDSSQVTISVSGFALSYAVNMVSLRILCDFCLSPAQFCCLITYILSRVLVIIDGVWIGE
jgi:hypothetical protein